MANSYFCEASLDDVMRCAVEEILSRGRHVTATKGGNSEIVGVLLEITNPRARLSRTESRGRLFSCLGELCWYLAKDDSLGFIQYYIPRYEKFSDDGVIHGGYGPRLFDWKGVGQFCNVARMLQRNSNTRKAVIQLYDRNDIVEQHNDVPCTCVLQFLVRDGVLHLLTYMRSNDVFVGFPHDVFCFTMLQELMSRCIGVDVGSYRHMAGSLHLYDEDHQKAREFLAEGWQQTDLHMPAMPSGDPWASVEKVLVAEEAIRVSGSLGSGDFTNLDPYWLDLIRLLQIFRKVRDREEREARELRDQISFNGYRSLVDRKLSIYDLR